MKMIFKRTSFSGTLSASKTPTISPLIYGRARLRAAGLPFTDFLGDYLEVFRVFLENSEHILKCCPRISRRQLLLAFCL